MQMANPQACLRHVEDFANEHEHRSSKGISWRREDFEDTPWTQKRLDGTSSPRSQSRTPFQPSSPTVNRNRNRKLSM